VSSLTRGGLEYGRVAQKFFIRIQILTPTHRDGKEQAST
jgi:hypothetical protein